MSVPSPSRRQFLASLGASALGATAGCVTYDRPSHEGRWPPEQNSYVTDTEGSGPNSYTAWSREVHEGYPPSMPIASNGVVYHLHSTEETAEPPYGTWLTAFDAATGETQWETRMWGPDEPIHFHHQGPPVFDDNRLFAQTHVGVKSLSTDGDVLWTFENVAEKQTFPDSVPPIVTNDVLVAGTYGAGNEGEPEKLYGLDRQTGERVWTQSFDSGELWRLTSVGETCYAPLNRGDGIVAVDGTTGETKRTYDIKPRGNITVTEDELIVPVDAGDQPELLSLETTGDVRWRVPVTTHYEANPVLDGTRLYYNEYETIVARRRETGEVLWKFGGTKQVEIHDATPVVAGDLLYVNGFQFMGDDEGYGRCVFVLNPETGDELGRITPWNGMHTDVATPAIAEGALYLADGFGNLLCLEDCTAGLLGHCLVG